MGKGVFAALVIGGLLLTPRWIRGLRRSIGALIEYLENRRQSGRTILRLTNAESGPWITRKPVLFFLGSMMILLGIVLTIFSRSRLFLPVSVVGMIFLCGLFFHCFMVAYKRDEKLLFHRKARATTLDGDPEQLLFFGHPPWIFDRPWLFLAGVLFMFLGIGLVVITRDVYLLLLSVFGIVFMLQVWSFWQLNSFTVTTERAIFQQAYPTSGTLVINRKSVKSVTVDQSLPQRLCRVCTLVIETPDEDIHVKLKHPREVRTLVERLA